MYDSTYRTFDITLFFITIDIITANINKSKKGPHFLRHTFASLLYMKSKDLVLVQEALGHADINTSRIYTHFDKDKLKVAMDIF